MKPNVGNVERGIRIAAGLILIALTLTSVIGWWGWIGIVPLITGLFRFCPAYRLLGINTCKRKPLDKPSH
ncbi:YgaP family membrane protein [Halomonas sp. GXIMD04776]|uniref:YgaP family membrane protein n=1 Tax=Halomonas sp. GXIMD04776 TaxID=3415605 RepID=UPI003C97D3D9